MRKVDSFFIFELKSPTSPTMGTLLMSPIIEPKWNSEN